MDVHKVLDLVLPLFTLIIVCWTFPLLLIFKFVRSILRPLTKEEVKGKVVLITGASSGIGENLAYEYAKEGAYLVLIARREDKLKVVAKKAGQLGSPDVLVVPADVTKVDDCKRFIEEAVNHFGKLDHLVCNAGFWSFCGFEEVVDVANLVQLMDANFWGSIYPTYFAIPHLKKSRGKIIVNSSISGTMFTARMSIYAASKAALISFYDNLRIELGPEVSITILTLGFVESELTRGKFMSEKGIVEGNQDLTHIILRTFPIESIEKCAKVIIDGVCHGKKYITEPKWYKNLTFLSILCPEVAESLWRILFLSDSSRPQLINAIAIGIKSLAIKPYGYYGTVAERLHTSNDLHYAIWKEGLVAGKDRIEGKKIMHFGLD
ncbi:hypothetical protein NE237_022855 [Protea cynaroides]|uniref:Uncharacterized protein n=1 Tax=Protea cynaroides TaxID=273540 RepID=A0A9Q0HAE8_9MAGN|nr:hypothetical protein NE237_022855 [Protea cynaroides]